MNMGLKGIYVIPLFLILSNVGFPPHYTRGEASPLCLSLKNYDYLLPQNKRRCIVVIARLDGSYGLLHWHEISRRVEVKEERTRLDSSSRA